MTTASGASPSPHPTQSQAQYALSQQTRRRDFLAAAHGSAAASSAVAAANASGTGGRPNQLQQRAAAAAQALNTERKVSTREIQAMLEKNEAALRGWNALHKQQRAFVLLLCLEHKEWARRCLLYRQQIGSRLEVLASLADRQIAQEDEKANNNQQVSPSNTAVAARKAATPATATATPPPVHRPPPAIPRQPSVLQVSGMGHNPALAGSSASSSSTSMVMPTMPPEASPTLFPEPPMPAMTFPSTSTSMFFPTGQRSTGFASTASSAVSGVETTTPQGFVMTSGGQTFAPNTYMNASIGSASSSAAFMTQQNYMMAGVMNPQQFLPMPMPMNLAPAGSGSMYDANLYNNNNNYGMGMTSTATTSSANSSSNLLPTDPFNASLDGFNPQMGFNTGPTGFPMTSMTGIPTQQQMMGSMNPSGFGTLQDPSMMANNFQYGAGGGVVPPPSSQGMMQHQPVGGMTQFQTTGSQAFQQRQPPPQQPPQQDGANSGMNLFPDAALFGDGASNANLFDGFPDDAFLQMP
ncbi:hypothetical protein BBJ28_00004015 [Nothophytophthora sp. Chile5]|nr:hypothetical protein BBJ28_00004015 [Nothophytophthora sp. Chile5]